MITIEYKCINCNDENHHMLGMPNYKFKQVIFTFSEAVKHVIETDHYIDCNVIDDKESKDNETATK